MSRSFLSEGPHLSALDNYAAPEGGSGHPLAWAFGALVTDDRTRHISTLYLNDLADVIRDAVDPRFELVRYARSPAQPQASLEPLAAALAAPQNLVDTTLAAPTGAALARHRPIVALISVPLPGEVHAEFRIAQSIKAQNPRMVTCLGSG